VSPLLPALSSASYGAALLLSLLSRSRRAAVLAAGA
jgi:hypothetical protein